MEKLKNNIDSITHDTENIVQEYKRLLKIQIVEKLSLFIGIIFSVFFLSTLLLIVVLILSVALSGFLNKILSSEFWGYLIVAGLYILLVVLLLIRAIKSETPLFTNLFVKLMAFFMKEEFKQPKTMKGLQKEIETVNGKLDLNKVKLKTDIQLLRFSLLDDLLQELLGLFSRKKRTAGKTTGKSSKAASTGPETSSKTDTKTDTKTSSETSSKTRTGAAKPKKRTRKKE